MFKRGDLVRLKGTNIEGTVVDVPNDTVHRVSVAFAFTPIGYGGNHIAPDALELVAHAKIALEKGDLLTLKISPGYEYPVSGGYGVLLDKVWSLRRPSNFIEIVREGRRV